MDKYNRYDLDKKFITRRKKQVREISGRDYGVDGRYRKQHPYDCGNSKCMICHSDKFLHPEVRNKKIDDDEFYN